MSKNKQLIQLPGNALEQLQNERMAKIQSYMDELGKHASIEHQAFDLVLAGELGRVPVPHTETARAELVERCTAMAQLVARAKLQRLNEGVKQIMREQNIHDVPDHVAWSARRAGVELVEQDATEPEAH